MLKQEFQQIPGLEGLSFHPAEDVNPLGKEFLHEHFFGTDSFHRAQQGEAFFIDETGTFLAVINIRNHLQLMLLEPDGELEHSWNRLVSYETQLGQSVEYAFNTEFGFLTADPKHCGTAFTGTAFLHLPALVHTQQLHAVLDKHRDESLTATGLQGDPGDLVGDILAIHNRFTLGVTEESILSSLRSYSTQLMLEERSTRRRLQEEQESQLKDEVSRAYGLLKHSFKLETIEAMTALSLLKLGLDLNWVKGAEVRQLNHLLVSCRRAHLQAHYNLEIDGEALSQKRAEMMHTSLGGVELVL
jgi:protein arginine kinase